MSNGSSGVSRGDRNRNAKLSRLRAAVPVTNAIVGIDLADRKQMVVVTDHDSKVLARRTFRVKAWELGAALDWANDRAARAGFAGVTVACEPTGHRWQVLTQLATDRGMPLVCGTRASEVRGLPTIACWGFGTGDWGSSRYVMGQFSSSDGYAGSSAEGGGRETRKGRRRLPQLACQSGDRAPSGWESAAIAGCKFPDGHGSPHRVMIFFNRR